MIFVRPHHGERPDSARQAAVMHAPWLEAGRRTAATTALRCKPGQVPLVTVSHRGASLWAVGLPPGPMPQRPFGRTALDAWDAAIVAVSRSLAVAWQAPPALRPASASWLGGLPVAGGAAVAEPVLEGRSFGLSFFLAAASVCLNVPLKPSLAASAEIEPDGTLRPIAAEGLEGKILCVADIACRVSTFVVHSSQVDLAREVVHRHHLRLRVRGADRAEDALKWALARTPLALIQAAGRSLKQRTSLIDSLFDATVKGRKAMSSWAAVESACGKALDTWPRLVPAERWYLKYVRAVAARHGNNTGTMPTFTLKHVARRPADDNLSVVANYVQHSTDTAKPLARVMLRIATRWIPSQGHRQHAGHARVMGAIGRLYSVVGRLELDLQWQKKAAALLFNCRAHDQASHQFAEWYRVAGIMRSGREIAGADAMLRKASMVYTGDSATYIALGRSQALVASGRPREACPELRRLVADDSIPRNPRSSAGRWLIRALDELGSVAEAQALLERGVPAEPKHQALVRLDRALKSSHLAGARRAIKALREADPGPMRHLLAAAPSGPLQRARFVQAHFPY